MYPLIAHDITKRSSFSPERSGADSQLGVLLVLLGRTEPDWKTQGRLPIWPLVSLSFLFYFFHSLHTLSAAAVYSLAACFSSRLEINQPKRGMDRRKRLEEKQGLKSTSEISTQRGKSSLFSLLLYCSIILILTDSLTSLMKLSVFPCHDFPLPGFPSDKQDLAAAISLKVERKTFHWICWERRKLHFDGYIFI